MEKVSYLEYEVEKDEVQELEIADESAREEISSMKTKLDGLQEDVENCDICGIATGSTVNITDSAEAPFEELTLYGESTQLQTTGSQSLNLKANSSTTSNGMSVSVKDGYIITVSGTSSQTWSNLTDFAELNIPSGKYTFSVDAVPSGVNGVGIKFRKSIEDNTNVTHVITGSKKSITVDYSNEFKLVQIYLDGCNPLTNYNSTFKVMLNAGETALPFEKYTGGKASPNPDYPQEIESKLVSYVTVCRKNQIDCSGLSEQSNAGITFTPVYKNGLLEYINVNGTWDSSNTATNTRYKIGTWYPKTKDKYILSGMTYLGDGSFLCLDKNSNEGGYEVVASTSNEFTVAEDANYYDVWLRIANGTSVSNLKVYPMIRLADVTDATYEPYQKQTVYLTNAYAMNGLNGVRDCIDAVRGVFSQNVYAKVFTGDESFRTYTPGVGGVQFGCEDENIMQIESENVLCTHLPPKFTWNVREDGIAITSSNSVVVRFRMESLGISTVEDLKAKLKEWYDAGNPMVLYAPIKTPEETALPAADVQALKALHTYSPSTTVNADAPMEVKYYRNTENGNVAGSLKEHTIDKNNPHGITKDQLGLDKVNNTADMNKYVYHAQKADEASWADKASLADKALCDMDNNEISSTYMKNNYFKEMTGTLTAGSTSLTLSHEEFSQGCTVEVYVLNKGVYTNNLIKPTDMSVSMVSGGNESLNLEFESQSNDLDIKVRFW